MVWLLKKLSPPCAHTESGGPQTFIQFIGVSDKWMFRNCCTYERVSTPPVPAFIFDFYWLDLCIKPDVINGCLETVAHIKEFTLGLITKS